ncbi:MAG: ribosome-associated translation inhibitor RaiA [Rhodothermales bacterium]|nr:ribosome-associated translation inhibitor RaiA [Rhodothermales bacterium]
MHTQITARHFTASPALQTYASDRLSRLEKYYDGITDAHVVLEEQPAAKAAEITLNVYRQRLAAQDAGSTHEEAIDRCVERLRKQIIRYKAKLRSKKRDVHH